MNDFMGLYIANQLIKSMMLRGIQGSGARVLIMGMAFKENCPDLRNTRVVDVIKELTEFGITIDVYDPLVDAEQAKNEYDLDLIDKPQLNFYDGIIIAVAHEEFKVFDELALRAFGKEKHVLYDIKYMLSPKQSDIRL
jgi:UDP-N-acetyl-D-galactosamine dehydrogenase